MTTQRATYWSVTINNPTPADEEAINIARQKGWKVEGQLEKGDGGTLHYQLAVSTPQVRFSALKKAFPRAHIEVARNHSALSQYVVKEDTRQASLLTTQEMYPSLSKYWTLLTVRYTALNRSHRIDNLDDLPTGLPMLDEFTELLILDGYNVESIAVNPQVRASWKRFAWSIMYRANRSLETEARQTDSVEQAQEIIVPTTIPWTSEPSLERSNAPLASLPVVSSLNVSSEPASSPAFLHLLRLSQQEQ